MKVLYFSEHYESNSFISRQVEEVSSEVDTYYMCCTADPIRFEVLKSRIFFLRFSENKFLTKFKRRLELADIYLNYFNEPFAADVKKVVESLKPEIIHCQYGYDAIKLLENYFNKDQKYVITFRGFDASLLLILSKYVEKLKFYLNQPNVHSIFVCQNLKDNLIKKGVQLNPVHTVIYSNTDTEFYTRQRYDLPKTPRVFTQVSNFREKKGHYYTILAFDKFLDLHPESDLSINFIGEQNIDHENLLKQISHLKIFERIRFLGKKDRKEIKEILENSHVFVHNSITSKHNDQEGIPNAIMEAMAMEMPILTTKHSGIPELAVEDVLLSTEKNIDTYVSNIEKVFWKGFSSLNRERIVNHFSKEKFKINILNFYTEVNKKLE
jgi:colanic acid/amylovoran biosynthesis glycosyltransferase